MPYPVALIMTLGLEAPLVWYGYRNVAKSALMMWAVFLAANLATHGALWALFPSLPGSYPARLVYTEASVFVLEAIVFRLLLGGGWPRALVISGLANAVSALLGILLFRFIL
jgi:hypothetical protein